MTEHNDPPTKASADMDTLRKRLDKLRSESEKGQKQLIELQSQERDLQQNLLRINGAIEVLEELLEVDQA